MPIRTRTVTLLFLASCSFAWGDVPGTFRPTALRCEYLKNPVGLDTPRPRFFWQIEDGSRRGSQQGAYRILVASRPELLAEGRPDVWDSSRVETSQTAHIVYDGPPLRSGTRYFWKIRAWDQEGKEADSTETAFWETALLRPEEWQARMIGWKQNVPETTESLESARWIWTTEGNPLKDSPKGLRYFRNRFELDPQKPMDSASLILFADANCSAHLNGRHAGSQNGYRTHKPLDVTDHVKPGANTFAVMVNNRDGGPAGLLAQLTVRYADGSVQRVATDGKWTFSKKLEEGWEKAEHDDKGWKPVRVAAEPCGGPWGEPALVQPGQPAALLRKAFTVEKPVRRARLYVTALGSYQPHLNGQRVGQELLTPDWTDYTKRLTYRTYDVTDRVKPGPNALGALLGSGWYGSPMGWQFSRGLFGELPPRLLMQLAIEHEDGTTATIISDESWKATDSPVRSSEIYDGELYDARLEKAGWDTAEYDDSRWEAVNVVGATSVPLSAQKSPGIRVTETLKPVEITSPAPGVHVFDMGQNMVGWARLRVQGPAGTTVTLRFGEILKPDGRLYRENLRRAEATDRYVLKGGGEEVFEPHFTYHGFRYIEMTGFPGEPSADSVEGLVFHTDVEPVGRFWSSSDLVNRVERNTLWGLRGNLHSIPTDCPQRDERLGWMGDAQIIWPTGCFSYDLAAFTGKWTRDMVDAQSPEGGFSNTSPRVGNVNNGAPGWGDAGIIIPYTAWRMYGDRRLLEENWEAMRNWMRYLQEANPDLLWTRRRTNDYGDWVPAGSVTPKDVIATAYWAYDAKLMAEMARALGRMEEAENYERLHEGLRKAFTAAHVDRDGRVSSRTQTCQILALHMDVVPEDLRTSVAAQLLDEITSANHHLTTGFLGTAYLLPVLSDHGMVDEAYRLLLNETYPSWGYMVRKGATTIWERWNSDKGDPGMNSFNHYCYGSVVEWLYRYAAGIDTTAGAPGFREFTVRPRIGKGLTEVRGEYDSLQGKIVSEWKRDGGQLALHVIVPANTRALVHVPTADAGQVLEGGRPTAEAPGVRFVRSEGGAAIYSVGGGNYRFTAPAP